MFNQDLAATRKLFFDAWQKFQENLTLAPLEKQIVSVIQQHPEYHGFFNSPKQYQDAKFDLNDLEANPFLHLGLHLSLLEQISTNRPKSITAIYRDLVINFGDAHHAEHHMMEILADTINDMLQVKQLPDEKLYLKRLKKLLKKGCSHSH